MITWSHFPLFALPALIGWASGATVALYNKERKAVASALTLAGTALFAVFIGGLWCSLQRPPLRTLGETRLWYAFFMSLSGWVTYRRQRHRWILLFSALLCTVFTVLNLLRPDIHDQSLMPALQSFWFIPHVTVYMFSYAVLGCACLVAVCGTYRHKEAYLHTADSLVYTGLAFLTVGMLTGALWAKAAWGHYWSWDLKETWAVITWSGYLLYVHLRLRSKVNPRGLYALLIVSFLALQMCWYGVNYLPSAAGSVHVYGQ